MFLQGYGPLLLNGTWQTVKLAVLSPGACFLAGPPRRGGETVEEPLLARRRHRSTRRSCAACPTSC